ncbi:glycosyl transferase family 1 [Maritimibacter sp. 55A14]|uniref:ABC-F family ATP-binding cassette domain-containing protein n=1 Tax=Maritimibacter sp. 55A14 TaxID=2174844 RepID=UPI000D605EF5|nr:ABC-F family ATP-binding cassette domain-containing protein [Maritimibacter sp. 55A14]PWE34159.1 glycosyl transferase family 1 [Maritimibacter sp. 55A14]
MLRISDISYSVEGRPLLEGASATIPTGHKVGLMGANGTGKTTLFRLIRGELALEGGEISMPSRTRIGGVAQEVPAGPTSLLDTVLAADTERLELMAEAETTGDAARIGEVHARLADIDAWSAEARAASILVGLGFDSAAQARPCADFSGGWRMRVALAAVLFAEPDLLLLDEPTNYLDLEGALWLESYLARYPHTVIIISHDRGLLNRAVGAILHLDERKLTLYQGPYDQFDRQRREAAAQAAAEARKQDAQRRHLQSYVDRFRYKADKARQAQSRLKMLERMEPITQMKAGRSIQFTFPAPDPLSPPIIALEGGAVGYGGAPVLRRLDLRIDQDDRIALLGRNGEGKSTLSKLLADKLPLMDGRMTRASRLRVGYFAQHQVDELVVAETPLQHLARALPGTPPAKLRARLAGFGLGADQAETAVGRLSGGQKARLSLLLATIDAPHLLILDEPTNHLDIESREALVQALAGYEGAVILVSHDFHLLNLTADRLWLVEGGAVRVFDDTLDAYRRQLLGEKPAAAAPAARPAPARPRPAPRDRIKDLRAEVGRCEARIEKLQEMRAKLDQRLADPALYLPGKAGEAAKWQKKRAEVAAGLELAESLWLKAQDKLDAAEG